MERIILHSDLNCFYASVAQLFDETLVNTEFAVAGSTEKRKGIILAKSQKAKEKGIKTGMVIWQAKLLCPNLRVVTPRYKAYIEYSNKVHEIYLRYTDLVEPYGLDECWLDVTNSQRLFGSGYEIAYKIKETIKKELKLTVSIGVSYTKVLAKLGSDLKNPDAITCIPKDELKTKVWPLSVNSIIGVGQQTTKFFIKKNIRTIGDLANCDIEYINKLLGKRAIDLISFARGEDTYRVRPYDLKIPYKSIGHGITCEEDLTNLDSVWVVVLSLTVELTQRLIGYNLRAKGVTAYYRTSDLYSYSKQVKQIVATNSALDIAIAAFNIIKKKLSSKEFKIRSISISLYDLVNYNQKTLNISGNNLEKREMICETVNKLKKKYGYGIINPTTLLYPIPYEINDYIITMPSSPYR